MTSLTDKMEGLRRKRIPLKQTDWPAFYAYNQAVVDCKALAKAEAARLASTTSAPGITIESTYVANKAEAAVVGDWQEEFNSTFLTIDGTQLIGTDSMRTYIKAFITTLLAAKDREITEDTSDGYHTFKELYEFRLLYNAVLFNEWSQQGKYDVHKSTKHSDGEDCFGGGWFIVVATLPTGDISNHYEMKDWDLFSCETRTKGKEWDGHTSKDVALRLRSLTPPTK